MHLTYLQSILRCVSIDCFTATLGPPLILAGVTDGSTNLICLYQWDFLQSDEPVLLCDSIIDDMPLFVQFSSMDGSSVLCITENGFICNYKLQMTHNSHSHNLVLTDKTSIRGSVSDSIQAVSYSYEFSQLSLGTLQSLIVKELPRSPTHFELSSAVTCVTSISTSPIVGLLSGHVKDVLSNTTITLHSVPTCITVSPQHPTQLFVGLASGDLVHLNCVFKQGKCVEIERINSLVLSSSLISCLTTSSHYLFAGTDDGRVVKILVSDLSGSDVGSLEEAEYITELYNGPLPIQSVCANGAGNLLLVATQGSSIALFPIE
ncbi:hypothetical protein RCL1_000765 [Eukaryota sp. TZLM3-RCL]